MVLAYRPTCQSQLLTLFLAITIFASSFGCDTVKKKNRTRHDGQTQRSEYRKEQNQLLEELKGIVEIESVAVGRTDDVNGTLNPLPELEFPIVLASITGLETIAPLPPNAVTAGYQTIPEYRICVVARSDRKGKRELEILFDELTLQADIKIDGRIWYGFCFGSEVLHRDLVELATQGDNGIKTR